MSTENFEEFVGKEFIEENIESCKKHHKNGGPYNKQVREARRNEVFRLHFEYGYPAIKIAEMMKVNRNTINNDINYMYSQLSKEWENHDIQSWWMRQMRRLEMQRTRLRERLDKETDFEKRVVLEKMILGIDNKLLQSSIKTITTTDEVIDTAAAVLNRYAKEQKLNVTYVRSRDINNLQTRNREKITQIVNRDKSNRRGRA
jgi:predicted DNA-binding protein YlxM (UPF0122 family)